MIPVVVGSCAWGPNLATFPPAHGPEGIASWLHVEKDSLRAELLAVDEDALLVLVDSFPPHRWAGRLARVPFAAIRRGELAHAGRVPRTKVRYIVATFSLLVGFFCVLDEIPDGDGRCGEDVETQPQPYVGSGTEIADDSELLHGLRLLSRYPQGVDDELLARLEATHGALISSNGPRPGP